MSYINLLASDRPLPLCDCRTLRTISDGLVSISGELGLAVQPCTWNPYELEHCNTKPFRYTLELAEDEQTFFDLVSYFKRVLSEGDTVELWRIWLGDPVDCFAKPQHYRGRLGEFDPDVFSLLFHPDEECCITIEV